MKTWMNYAAAFAVGSTLLLASCGDDGDDPLPPVLTNDAPTLRLQNPDMSMMGSTIRRTNQDPGQRVEFTLVAEDRDNNLQSLTVDRNGTQVTIPTSNVFVTFNGTLGPLDNNPRLLLDADTTGFTKLINVRTAAAFGDSVTYSFTVTDKGVNNVSREEATVTITLVNGRAPTPLAAEIRGAEFYNQSSPSAARPGALDLDTGTAIASNPNPNTMVSDLQDQGNLNSGTWRKTVQTENGANMRKVRNNDGSVYSSVNNLDDLLDVFNNNTFDQNNLSDIIMNGDVYIVTRTDATAGDKFFMVQFAEVVDEAGTANDKYVVNIKQN